MVRGKRLTAHMWDRYIKKNHPLSNSSLVDSVMLHHAASYDPTLPHLDLNGKVNGEGVYHHFVTGKICLLSTAISFSKRARRGITIK